VEGEGGMKSENNEGAGEDEDEDEVQEISD
jgi:hypothetical protein